MLTKGALLHSFDTPWVIEEIEIGDPRPGEVKVQMEAAGLCHSDYHLATGAVPMAGFPVLGGHEGAGIVTEVGDGVTTIAVGDHVVLSFIPSCGHCYSCQKGLRNLCDLGMGLLAGSSVADGTFRVQSRGRNVYPMSLLGTFSPYLVVHQSSVVKIDEWIPFEVACLVGCGVTTGWGSSVHSGEVEPGDDVAVVGLGGVGMSALQGALSAGARYVFAIDPVEWKREQALKFGATHTFESMAAAASPIAEITWGRMAAKTIVCVGEMRGEYVDQAMGITAKAGRCVVTAMGSLTDTKTELNLAMLTLLQKELRGSIFGGSNPQVDIPNLLSLYRVGKLNLDDMVTTQYCLEDVNQGFRDMLDGRNIRGIIRYTERDR